MDTGSAPVSGYVAIYAIWNPMAQTAALLATNATSAAASNVYAGANMPSGYTASALVSIWTTNASSQFITGTQRDRVVARTGQAIYSETVTRGAYTSFSAASVIPPNAKFISGTFQIGSSTTSNVNLFVAADSNGDGAQGYGVGTTGAVGSFNRLPLLTPQTFFVLSTSTAGTPAFSLNMSAYEF
jgi:hypothetical protein